MAASIDHFGPISQGYDRAQIGISPPINNGNTDVRPPDSNTQRRQSLHLIINDNLPLLLTHPRRGFRRFRTAVEERRSASSPISPPQNVPILAPAPPVDVKNVRLHSEVQEKPKLPPFKDAISHPVSTVKSLITDQGGVQFSENLAKSEVPHSASVNLLIQDRENAKVVDEDEKAEGLTKLIQLKHLRQDAFVRWTVDRHVREVIRIPDPLQRSRVSPASGSWITKSKQTLNNKFAEHIDYYIDESVEWPHPDRKVLASTFERIVVASTQMQKWYMDIRAISHWDNPRVSACYAAGYLLLVCTGHVPSMLLLFIIAKIWTRRNQPPDVQSMWESVAHSEDKETTPQHLSELIIQYGTQGWVDHAIDRAGPALYVKLEHIADIMEMVQNAYEWRDPFRTTMLMCSLTFLLIATTILPSWVLIKGSLFFVGIDFFVLAPIGYYHPEYRLLVSPFTWLLWKVPTHADWAIARLQAEGREQLVCRGAKDSTSDGTGGSGPGGLQAKIGNYRCENEPKGEVIITTESVSFIADSVKVEHWTFQLCNLQSMKKISKPTRTDYIDGLHFGTSSGMTHEVMGLQQRDEVFSQIVGYSKVPWKRIA